MIRAFEITTVLVSCLLLSAGGGSLFAQSPGRPVSLRGSEADARPSLEELKVIGAKRSSYLREQVVGSGKRLSKERLPEGKLPEPRLDVFRAEIEPIFEQSCIYCHDADTKEGNIQIDALDPDLLHGDDVDWWIEILSVLSKGEMPPADEPELADEDRAKLVEWLSQEIQLASQVRRAEQGHSSFRRMTRYEYNYALQDLLGLPFDFAKDLPPESTSEDGFQNSSEMLNMSSVRFEYYRELSRAALKRAVVEGEQPSTLFWGVSMKAASASDWEEQERQLQKLREEHKADPAKVEQEVDRKMESFRAKHRNAYYANLNTGQTAKANWSYPGAKYAWEPSEVCPEVPAASEYVAVIPARQKLIIELGDRLPEEGTLRVRVRAARASAENGRLPSLQLEFGWQASNDSQASVRISDVDIPVDARPGEPQFYQWEIPMSEVYPRNSVRHISKMGDLPSPSEYLKLVNSSRSQGDIHVDYIEVSSPVYEQWPPASHQRIFGGSEGASSEGTGSEGTGSEREEAEADRAREIISGLMERAWRREVTEEELARKLALFEAIRDQCDSFEAATVEVLSTVLASPQFLYLVRGDSAASGDTASADPLSEQTASKSEQFELATRLTMFLWCSTPDDELLRLASAGALSSRDVLLAQVERMLADPRSKRFSKHFVSQWLGMQLLEYLSVDRKVYPQFDPSLKEAMLEEPIAFFEEVLRNNDSILDFIHADYAMANERLAAHYGMRGVWGNEFRRVKIDVEQQNRGGLLTQAGLLAMNSDGKDSHPLKRGIWLLESLLNDPPPPPPPAVPEIDLADPEIAKLTLKQRIENHRNQAACMSCHAKIDPWGIAFENFDAVGGWRSEINGSPVDASSLLFNKQKLDGIDGLKRFLLENRQDQFARAMVHKVTTYALGRPLTFADRSSVDEITADLRKQGDGLATLVKLIVLSDLFLAN